MLSYAALITNKITYPLVPSQEGELVTSEYSDIVVIRILVSFLLLYFNRVKSISYCHA